MSSCFRSRKKDADRQPLLPVYEDDTSLQRATHQKLHSYQMLRALSKGFMPSTEQTIANLRVLLASDILNLETMGLSDSGRRLMKYTKQWLTEFIEFLKNKNDQDQIQDFIWFLVHARMEVHTGDLISTARNARAKADAAAVYESIKTVGSLLLTNSDFRIFLSDLNTIGRQVFADTASTLSNVTEDAAKQIEPSAEENEAANNPNAMPDHVSKQDLETEAAEIADVISNGLRQTGQEVRHSIQENVSGSKKDTLVTRLKATVTKLRKRNDYTESVSTIGLLIQQYTKVYSKAVEDTISTVQDDVNTNDELDRAARNGWSLLSSFGDKEAWEDFQKRVDKVMSHAKKDPEFEDMMMEVSASVQKMLTDPNFFDSANQKIEEVKEKSKEVGTESPLRQDINSLLRQIRIVFNSVVNDSDVSKLLSTTFKLWDVLSPAHSATNQELFTDTYTVFIPHLIQAMQYIPIPRIEIAVPEIDLLLENFILEPGRTINDTSFLPFCLKVETFNDLSIRKARFGTVSSLKTIVTIRVQGLSVRADEVGFWFRAHKGLLRLSDEGIACFELDDRGIDVEFDVEVGKEHLEKILSLRNVRVKIHHLSYTVRKSKLACLAWIFKPLLRPIFRKILERQLATAIGNFFHAANRELLFARERLRATQISNPRDLRTFVKAVITRLTPAEDPDLYSNIGITGGSNERGNIFAGKYAPGSVVKLWNDEAVRAGEIVDDHAKMGWRNDIFNVQTANIF